MGGEIHVFRSLDGGCTFEQIVVGGGDPQIHMSEVSLVAHPSGRVVALIRNPDIHCSLSNDHGQTWTKPVPTGIRDTIPMHAICQANVTILCVGAHRGAPSGIRATVSHDAGESWNVANPIILRDDLPPSGYIGGPGSIQLDDEFVFTFYNIIRHLEPDQKQPHCFIAGSIYEVE